MGNNIKKKRETISNPQLAQIPPIKKKYKVISILGQGAFGTVLHVMDVTTKVEYALKFCSVSARPNAKSIISMKITAEDRLVMIKNSFNEKDILEKLTHPNIVKYEESFLVPGNPLSKDGKLGSTHLCLVEEYISGADLDFLIELSNSKNTTIPLSITINWFIKLLDSLAMMHKNNIIHRDIKTDNILVSYNDFLDLKSTNLKWSDFGSAIDISKTGLGSGIAGHLFFAAPEVLEEKNYDGRMDMWALGIVFFQVLTKTSCSQFENIIKEIFRVIRNDKKRSEELCGMFNLLSIDECTYVQVLRFLFSEDEDMLLNKIIRKQVIDQCLLKLICLMITQYDKRIQSFELLKHPIILTWKYIIDESDISNDIVDLNKIIDVGAVLSFLRRKEKVFHCISILSKLYRGNFEEKFLECNGIEALLISIDNISKINKVMEVISILNKVMMYKLPDNSNELCLVLRESSNMTFFFKYLKDYKFDNNLEIFLFFVLLSSGNDSICVEMIDYVDCIFKKINNENKHLCFNLLENIFSMLNSKEIEKKLQSYLKLYRIEKNERVINNENDDEEEEGENEPEKESENKVDISIFPNDDLSFLRGITYITGEEKNKSILKTIFKSLHNRIKSNENNEVHLKNDLFLLIRLLLDMKETYKYNDEIKYELQLSQKELPKEFQVFPPNKDLSKLFVSRNSFFINKMLQFDAVNMVETTTPQPLMYYEKKIVPEPIKEENDFPFCVKYLSQNASFMLKFCTPKSIFRKISNKPHMKKFLLRGNFVYWAHGKSVKVAAKQKVKWFRLCGAKWIDNESDDNKFSSIFKGYTHSDILKRACSIIYKENKTKTNQINVIFNSKKDFLMWKLMINTIINEIQNENEVPNKKEIDIVKNLLLYRDKDKVSMKLFMGGYVSSNIKREKAIGIIEFQEKECERKRNNEKNKKERSIYERNQKIIMAYYEVHIQDGGTNDDLVLGFIFDKKNKILFQCSTGIILIVRNKKVIEEINVNKILFCFTRSKIGIGISKENEIILSYNNKYINTQVSLNDYFNYKLKCELYGYIKFDPYNFNMKGRIFLKANEFKFNVQKYSSLPKNIEISSSFISKSFIQNIVNKCNDNNIKRYGNILMKIFDGKENEINLQELNDEYDKMKQDSLKEFFKLFND